MAKISKLRKNTLNEISHNNVETIKRIEAEKKEIPWEIKLDRSNCPVYVDTLSSKVKRDKLEIASLVKRAPFKIDSPLFKTERNFPFHHMPKIEDVYYKRLNFSFGETKEEQKRNFEDMLNAPKSLVLYYRHKEHKDGKQFLTLRAYFIASKLTNENLPEIYRIDITTQKENNKYKLDHIKASAVVGGCVDGECPLFEIGGDEKETRLYVHKNGKTFCDVNFDDDTTNLFYEVKTIDVQDVFQASDYAFKRFNVENIFSNNPFGDSKLSSVLKALHSPQKNNYVTPISGDKFVGLTIGDNATFETDKSWQYVYNKNGKLNKTNTPKNPEF